MLTKSHQCWFTGLVTAIVGAGLLLASVPQAEARPRPRTRKFVSNKNIGLGVMIGAPTGFTGKYYLGADTAIDFGIGAFGGSRRRDGFQVYADFLWHPAVLGTTEPFIVPLYFGVGARLFDFDDGNDDDDLALGARIPAGIMLDFNNVPVEVFLEFSLVLDFILDGGGIDGDFGLALGARYYF